MSQSYKKVLAARKASNVKTGVILFREINKHNKNQKLLISKEQFAELVRSISQSIKPDIKFQSSAICILHNAIEQHLVSRFYNIAVIQKNKMLISGYVTEINRKKEFPIVLIDLIHKYTL